MSGGNLSARAGRAADQPIGYLMAKALAQPELVSLAAGFVDQASLPVEAARSAALSLLSDPSAALAALQYGTTRGDPHLRGQILERVYQQDRAAGGGEGERRCGIERVVLTAGSNQLLYLLAEALLEPGDIVLCEAPTYFVFTGILRTLGARAIGVASDADGLCVDALEQQLAKLEATGELARVKAMYVMSYFDNPRSVCLSRARRSRLVALARERGIYLIEDAAYRELRYAGEDPPSLWSEPGAEGSVIYAGTFSKSFSPGVRVGYGVLPEALVAPLSSLKDNLDFGSPHLNQCLIREALRLGVYETHVAALRTVYARKCEAMLEALERELGGAIRYTRPDGGLYVWAELADELDTGHAGGLFEVALEEGVLYVPGAYCFPAEGAAASSACMRLSFGVQSEERIALGVRRLARAITRLRSSRSRRAAGSAPR